MGRWEMSKVYCLLCERKGVCCLYAVCLYVGCCMLYVRMMYDVYCVCMSVYVCMCVCVCMYVHRLCHDVTISSPTIERLNGLLQ